MSDLNDTKGVVISIVKSSPFGEISLLDLANRFQSIEGISLRIICGDFGFDGLTAMIRAWPEMVVTGSGLNTKVRFIETNQISELKKHSK